MDGFYLHRAASLPEAGSDLRPTDWGLLHLAGGRIFPVVQPLHGILGDVEADGIEVFGATHDMFEIVSLPDRLVAAV